MDAAMRSRKDIMHIRTMPNPTEGRINVEVFGEMKSGVKLTLMKSDGAVVNVYNLAEVGTLYIDLSGLPAGVYLLQASYDGKSSTQRIVLK